MGLPAPNLDDRRFQQLVDEAKRMVQQRCPAWSDHNVSDPGVTLIETFAYMTDALLYRLNRVPDRNYVKFLELIGVHLFPPTAARADVTFWLAAPQEETVVVPEATEVTTRRTDDEEAVEFRTTQRLHIVPSQFAACASQLAGDETVDTTDAANLGQGFSCFARDPQPGDALLIGLSDPTPSCAVAISLDCRIEGVGVDPLDPPLQWEAWDGHAWAPCEVDSDGTGGFNQAGDVVIHLPASHTASVVNSRRAGWLRARVTEPADDQPFYSASPRIVAVSAVTVGGTVEAMHAERVADEIVGMSEGVPGQRFVLQRTPVLSSDEPVVLEVAAGSGWERWAQVDDFSESTPDDTHFVLDALTGELEFGPAVREPNGSLRRFGAVPPSGAPIRAVSYLSGGGSRGNVAPGRIEVLQQTVPFVSRVENRTPATGGVDAESIDAAKIRGPILLRTRNRAVTTEDYEHLAHEAAPEVARVRAIEVGPDQADAGAVRVLIVPHAAPGADGRLRFEQLVPADDTLRRISDHLDARRCVGARVVVEPPRYQGVTVVARVRASSRVSPARLARDASAALYRYIDPLTGGPDGAGWPFGRPVHVGEVYAVLQRVHGVEFVEDARLFAADPITGQRGEQTERIEVDRDALVFSFGHQVRAEP
jgi:predicted phage baseplate assembly protein